MHMVIVTIYARCIRVAHGVRMMQFPTTGRDDPRIHEAITRCRDAGFTVWIYS